MTKTYTSRTPEHFTPDTPELWRVLNASHIGFPKIVEEFVDNALAAGARNIYLYLTQLGDSAFQLMVEDDGCGFGADKLTHVFSVGYPPEPSEQSSGLNQYGIGLKSALASCDPSNILWSVSSHRKEDTSFIYVSAPFKVDQMDYTRHSLAEVSWPGRYPETGTLLDVPVSGTLLRSCDLRAKSDQEQIDALKEDLEVTYAPRLAREEVSITLEWVPISGDAKVYTLKALTPDWTPEYRTSVEQVDLGRGNVEITYSFGRIFPDQTTGRYFCGNISSSGMMVYLNGRLIQSNLFGEIWNKPHPQFNSFLFLVDLRAVDGNLNALPIPTPDKDQMVLGDPRFQKLLAWARKLCPSPRDYVFQHKESEEAALCRDLQARLEATGTVTCSWLEMPLLIQDSGKAARSDLYVRTTDGRAVLYEAKAKTSKIQDLAQLSAYALAYAEDGLQLDELILVARKHNPSVVAFRDFLASRWFRDMKTPVIRLLTWAEVEAGIF